jgi:hypothetical protein
MPILIGRWTIEDAASMDRIRGPAAMLKGRRVGQAILELKEQGEHWDIPFGWFKVLDSRSVEYKLELDAEAPRELQTGTSFAGSASNTASDARPDAGGTPKTTSERLRNFFSRAKEGKTP